MEQLLRRELKSWQKAFKAEHGREPTKRDILADDAIAGTYDTWQAVGGDAKSKLNTRPKDQKAGLSSKQRLDGSVRDESISTPSKRRTQSRAKEGAERTPSKRSQNRPIEAGTPSRNPFRTPTKLGPTTPAGKSRNPFASPTKPSVASPAGSMIDVEMTPVKRSPLLSLSRTFTPTKSPRHQQYITSSPSKLRSTLESSSPTKARAALTPIKSPSRRVTSDAALNAALVAYTPRTKARKRLRGEDVPLTPGRGVKTEPRAAVQKGLGAFGFASGRKRTGRKSDPTPSNTSVFGRKIGAKSTGEEEEQEEMQPPFKAGVSSKGFRPLFASPSGLGANQLGPSFAARGSMNEDADALMEDSPDSPVGGLFAAHVQQQRRRAREGDSVEEQDAGLGKKHKIRPAVQLPESDGDEDAEVGVGSSSPPPYRRNGATSSPNTELTVPSSTLRPPTSRSKQANAPSSSPTRPMVTANRSSEDTLARTGAWRKVHRVELSDEDEPDSQSTSGPKVTAGRKKIISITPYQLYGSLRTSSPFPSSPLTDGDEEGFSPYSFPTQPNRSVYAVDPNSPADSDSDDNLSTHASLAGLQLSPVRHAPSTKRDKEQRLHLLSGIFDPVSTKNKRKTLLNPEARCGPLQPNTYPADNDDQDHDASEADHDSNSLDDDDDDWQQEVEEDFTFLDSGIELQDVA